MAKLSVDQIAEFFTRVAIDPTFCQSQRLGQCFLNKHTQFNLPDPDLYYCEDWDRAIRIIYNDYVDMELT